MVHDAGIIDSRQMMYVAYVMSRSRMAAAEYGSIGAVMREIRA